MGFLSDLTGRSAKKAQQQAMHRADAASKQAQGEYESAYGDATKYYQPLWNISQGVLPQTEGIVKQSYGAIPGYLQGGQDYWNNAMNFQLSPAFQQSKADFMDSMQKWGRSRGLDKSGYMGDQTSRGLERLYGNEMDKYYDRVAQAIPLYGQMLSGGASMQPYSPGVQAGGAFGKER